MSERRVVAVLGRGLVPADTPILRADDLGALRGDGIFETIRVWGGRPWLLAEHLARLARSAARLELAVPPEATLVDLVDQACSAWPRDAEGVLRLVCTRGPEDGGEVTAYATIAPVGEAILRARAEGVRVLTATLGVPATARPDAPWLLGGAKTVSYAVNMACLRWAAARGADDVLWTSTDGYALEAPTATLVWLDGDVLRTVPPERTGVLAGTTARHLFDRAGEVGLRADERMIRPAELSTMDGVWLASSVRGLVEVRAIDGEEPPVRPDLRRPAGQPPDQLAFDARQRQGDASPAHLPARRVDDEVAEDHRRGGCRGTRLAAAGVVQHRAQDVEVGKPHHHAPAVELAHHPLAHGGIRRHAHDQRQRADGVTIERDRLIVPDLR